MKKYKSYLQVSENNIPRATDHRRSRHGRDKENCARVVYKKFVSTSESDIPRTSAHRKRNTLFPVHPNDNVDASVQGSHYPGPAKRPRTERQTQDVSHWSIADRSDSDSSAVPHQTESVVTAEEGYNEATRNQSVADGSDSDFRALPHQTESLVTAEESYNEAMRNQINKDQMETGGHQKLTANLQPAPDVTQPAQSPNYNALQDSEEDELLYPGAPLSKGQSLLLLMAYILRHNLTGIALEHLLKMFNEHFPGSMPATSYLFHKAYGQYGQYESHFYCSGCTSYIACLTAVLERKASELLHQH